MKPIVAGTQTWMKQNWSRREGGVNRPGRTPCRPGRSRIPIVWGRRTRQTVGLEPAESESFDQPGRTARKTITRRKHCECSALWTCTCFTPPWNISYIYGRCAKLCFEDLRLSVTRKKRCERTALCTYLRFASISVYQKIVRFTSWKYVALLYIALWRS